jgi:hypothetical protein
MLFDINSQIENDRLVETGLSIKYLHTPQYVSTFNLDNPDYRVNDRTKRARDSLRALLIGTHAAICRGKREVFGREYPGYSYDDEESSNAIDTNLLKDTCCLTMRPINLPYVSYRLDPYPNYFFSVAYVYGGLIEYGTTIIHETIFARDLKCRRDTTTELKDNRVIRVYDLDDIFGYGKLADALFWLIRTIYNHQPDCKCNSLYLLLVFREYIRPCHSQLYAEIVSPHIRPPENIIFNLQLDNPRTMPIGTRYAMSHMMGNETDEYVWMTEKYYKETPNRKFEIEYMKFMTDNNIFYIRWITLESIVLCNRSIDTFIIGILDELLRFRRYEFFVLSYVRIFELSYLAYKEDKLTLDEFKSRISKYVNLHELILIEGSAPKYPLIAAHLYPFVIDSYQSFTSFCPWGKNHTPEVVYNSISLLYSMYETPHLLEIMWMCEVSKIEYTHINEIREYVYDILTTGASFAFKPFIFYGLESFHFDFPDHLSDILHDSDDDYTWIWKKFQQSLRNGLNNYMVEISQANYTSSVPLLYMLVNYPFNSDEKETISKLYNHITDSPHVCDLYIVSKWKTNLKKYNCKFLQ